MENLNFEGRGELKFGTISNMEQVLKQGCWLARALRNGTLGYSLR